MPEWRVTRHRGKFALTFERDGRRQRFTLNTDDPREAYRIAPALYAEVTKPAGRTVKDLWDAYTRDKAGRSVVTTMGFTWKALDERFGPRHGESITVDDCRAHIDERRRQGKSDGTIHTELGHLRTVLKWAENHRLIDRAPHIERPSKPEPKERHLTRDEAQRLLAATTAPHIKVAMHLMLGTAARVTAILELTWDRVDFERGLIFLRDPNDKARRKGRAVVPMTRTLAALLRETQEGAMSDRVVEWGGEPVKSLKKGIATAARNAKLDGVSAHVFRHTAAVWMAEAGVSMEEISQYLGHSNVEITRRVYARFSPQYLKSAASALELGPYEVTLGTGVPGTRNRG